MANVNAENILEERTLGPARMTRLDPEDDEMVQEIARDEDRPLAQVIRRLVREALAPRHQQAA